MKRLARSLVLAATAVLFFLPPAMAGSGGVAFNPTIPSTVLELPVPPVRALSSSWCGTGSETAAEVRRLSSRGRARMRAVANAVGTTGAGRRPEFQHGFIIVESDDLVTPFAKPLDLVGSTLDLERVGSDRFFISSSQLAYETGIGPRIASLNATSPIFEYTLTGFVFPFYGSSYTSMRIRRDATILLGGAIRDPERQYGPADALSIEEPVIAAMMQSPRGASVAHEGSMEVHAVESAQSLILTFRLPPAARGSVDVQMILFADGDIRISYREVEGFDFGTLLVTSGSEGWRSRKESLAVISDLSGDVGTELPPTLRPALDILSTEILRVGESELLEVRMDLAAELDPETLAEGEWALFRTRIGTDDLLVWVDRDGVLFDPPGLDNGGWSGSVFFEGATLTVRVYQPHFAVPDGDRSFWSATYSYGAEVSQSDITRAMPVGLSPAMSPVVIDASALGAGREIVDAPIVESFTVPSLNPDAVWQQVAAAGGYREETIDFVAIHQTFDTDIVFYAGAYSTVGNPQVDGIAPARQGIGTGNARFPALLHMNRLGRYPDPLHVLTHEIGHRWLYFIQLIEGEERSNASNPDGGHPSKGLHIPAAHPRFSTTASSPMGGSYFTQVGPLAYRTPGGFDATGFSWHELYLMGLATAEEASAPWFYLTGEGLEGVYYPAVNREFAVEGRTDVTFSQMTGALGPRTPSYEESQKVFRYLSVIVKRPGEVLTEAQLVEWRAENIDGMVEHFAQTTGGRGRLVPVEPVERRRPSRR